jgi:D-alanyl-D-alanine carboxypeptidase
MPSPDFDRKTAALIQELGICEAALDRRGLKKHTEARSLVVAEVGIDGRSHLLIPAAAMAWVALKADARKEGIALFVVSAFRSIDRQAEVIRRKLSTGVSLPEILAVSAPPGYSEHHTGCAVDVSTPGTPALETEFEKTSAFAWLIDQAPGYGFRLSYPVGNSEGYTYEPWHWCYQPTRRRSGRRTAMTSKP